MDNTKLENFEAAFRAGSAGCRRTCNCGVEYYDGYNSYDWDAGEFEKLRADKSAIGLEYAPR